MLIRINPHTLERAAERGATKDEVEDVIRTGTPIPAKRNRQAKEKVFDFRRQRQNVYYDQKKVQVIYVLQEAVAMTVTVYVFYGKWEG
ncbi:MAG: hypothetical protein A3H28_07350 [Acidobacteria bacterium RIFCSPLOWO2_02_FULL_61_28]|nr:MAG: hypothetical protein A3H28_07350 [Acidobacteria bacterium RIFCSPLOWO2_02_FULL_61_28]